MYAPSDQYSLDEIRPEPEHSEPAGMPGLEVVPPGNPDDVLREQLEELIQHSGECTQAGCPRCQRYGLARALLLAPFV